MKELDLMLNKSIAQYSKILSHINNLSKTLENCKTDELKSFCDCLNELQNDARKTDKAIDTIIEQKKIDIIQDPRLVERKKLMREIVNHNNLLFPQINGKLAVIGAELTQLKAGMNALSGYKSGQITTGKIINNAY